MTDWMPLIIVSAPPTILTGGTLLLGWFQRRNQDRQHRENKNELNRIHVEINGRMGELLKVTGDLREALGVKKEQERASAEKESGSM